MPAESGAERARRAIADAFGDFGESEAIGSYFPVHVERVSSTKIEMSAPAK